MVALALVLLVVGPWRCLGFVHLPPSWRQGTCAPVSMSATHGGSAVLAKLWPQLAGQQTSANPAAGAILDAAWAQAEAQHSSSSEAPLHREMINYWDGATSLQGFVVRPGGGARGDAAALLPCVLVAHTAVGPQENFLLLTLDAVARLGYVAFGLDMFGAGRALWSREESMEAREPLTRDRAVMAHRAAAALSAAAALPGVDLRRIAAVGYCFGGLPVLDLVRVGAPLRAAVTFHGVLAPPPPGALPPPPQPHDKACAVVVLHGAADPFVPAADAAALREELAARGVTRDCEVVAYPHALHAFTRPEKLTDADRAAGLQHDAHAAADAWARMRELLSRALA